MIIVNVIAPVFIVVLAGYLAAYTGVLKTSDTDGLSRFVFNISLPVLLFNALATVSLPESFNWRFFLAYYGVLLLIYGLGMGLSRRLFAAPAQDQPMFGIGAAYSNLVLVGLPIISAGLGDEALLPLFLLVSIHSAVLFFITAVFMERNGANGRSPRQIAHQTGKGLLRNPIVMGLALGAVVNLLNIPLPQPFAKAIEITKQATLPCALFILGASLTTYKLNGYLKEASLIVVLKLLLQPLLVWLLVFHLFNIEPLWATVAVIAAGMPVGMNTYIFIQKYEVNRAILSTAVLLSTLLATISQSLWLLLLT